MAMTLIPQAKTNVFPIAAKQIAPPRSIDEAERLAALRSLELLDTDAEDVYDAITRQAAAICDVPLALISLVDQNRQWFKSRFGIEVPSETERSISFCTHTIHKQGLMEVNDALRDENFRLGPLVQGFPHIRFYAGVPLRTTDGHAVGTLCVIDQEPRVLTTQQRDSLKDLARVASGLLDSRKLFNETKHISSLINAGFDEVFMLDTQTMSVKYVSSDTAQSIGRDRTEILGTNFDRFTLGYPWDELKRLGESSTATHVAFKAQHLRADKSPYPVEVCAIAQGRGDVGEVLLLVNDITTQEQEEKRLQDLAKIDLVTRLPNQYSFDLLLNSAMEATRTTQRPFALMLTEIERFSEIRHCYGQLAAEQVQREYASRLRKCAGAGNIVAHLGGEIFALILDDACTLDYVHGLAGRIASEMMPSFQTDLGPIQITSAIGVAQYQGGEETAQRLQRRASDAIESPRLSNRPFGLSHAARPMHQSTAWH